MAQKWHLSTTLTFKNLMLKLAINIDRLYRCMFFIIEVPLGEEIHIHTSVCISFWWSRAECVRTCKTRLIQRDRKRIS